MNNSGIGYLLEGFKLMTRPGIRLYVAIPLTINVVLFAVLVGLTLQQFGAWIEGIMDWLPSWEWLGFIRWILWPMAITLVLTVVMYTFSIVANLVAAPFNGLLAEKTEELLTGREVAGHETLKQALASFPRTIVKELRKILYWLPWALLVLILSFIFSPIAPALWFCLGAWMMALEYCDYPMDNHKKSFKEVKAAIASQRSTSFIFGSGVMFCTMIPILNFLIMPAAVCGATKYWVEQLSQQPGLPKT